MTNGAPPGGGSDVLIHGKRYGESAYAVIAQAQTDSEGYFQLVVRPTIQTSFVATAMEARSTSVLIRAHARLVISSYNSEANGGFVIRGRVLMGGPPPRVGLAQIDSGWRYLSSAPAASDFTYVLRYPLPFGDHVYELFTSSRGGNLRGSTRFGLSRLT